MTREEYLDKVLYGLRRVNEALFETKLLDLAHKILMTEEYSEDNFDVAALLVDCYKSRYLASLDEINASLLYAQEYLELSKNHEIG